MASNDWGSDGLGSLPANSKSPAPADPISRIGFEILSNAKGGISTHGDQRALLEGEGVEFRTNGTVDLKRFRWAPRED